jgi:cysteinyl-tRNA synthetase
LLTDRVRTPSHGPFARAYLSFDIVWRLLVDFFRYYVTLIKNITTDPDDKIIARSAEQGASKIGAVFEMRGGILPGYVRFGCGTFDGGDARDGIHAQKCRLHLANCCSGVRVRVGPQRVL